LVILTENSENGVVVTPKVKGSNQLKNVTDYRLSPIAVEDSFLFNRELRNLSILFLVIGEEI